MSQEWAVETSKGQVRVSDLTLDALIELEDLCGEEWWRIIAHPLRTAKAAKYVYAAACAQTGAEPETLTPRKFEEVFVQVPEDLPDSYQDGLPLPEGAASTSGSSGAPPVSTGPQTKSDG